MASKTKLGSFVRGMARTLDIGGVVSAPRPKRGSLTTDITKLRQDAVRIGDDLRRVAARERPTQG